MKPSLARSEETTIKSNLLASIAQWTEEPNRDLPFEWDYNHVAVCVTTAPDALSVVLNVHPRFEEAVTIKGILDGFPTGTLVDTDTLVSLVLTRANVALTPH